MASGLCAVAAAAAVAASLLAPSGARAQEPGLSFVGATEAPLVLSSARGYRADLRLVLRNPSTASGRLRIRYFADDGTEVVADTRGAAGLRITLAPGTAETIDARAVQPLGLRFFSADRKPESVRGGVLVVDVPSAPALAPASIGVTPPAAAKTGFYQDGVEVTVTRHNLWDKVAPDWLGGGDEGHLVVPVRGGGNVASTARLVSGSGGHANVTLGPTVDDHSTLTVEPGLAAGSYSGKLQPAGADPLSVTVHVQDWFVYPLLAVLFGAGLGWLLSWQYEKRRRPRWVTEHALSVARSEYAKADADRPEGLESLDVDGRIAGIQERLRRAGAQDDFDDATQDANDFVGTVNRWIQLATSLSALKDALAAVRAVEDPDPGAEPRTAQGDTERLLKGRFSAENAARADADVKLLDGQTEILAYYCDAVAEDPQKAAALYGGYPAAPERTDEQTLELGVKLRWTKEPSAAEVDLGGHLQQLRASDAFPALRAAKRLDKPEELKRKLRLGDLLVFLVKASLVTAVYMVTLYAGKEFGGFDDYVTAVAAGAIGQLAIPWDLLPSARTVRRAASA